MLKFWDLQELKVEVPGAAEPATYFVYGDDLDPALFYVVPRPTLRINDEDRLSFSFLKYRRAPADAPPGAEAGGAYLVLDTELDVPGYASRQILAQLAARAPGGAARLGRIPYTAGSVRLLVPSGPGQLVRAIESLGKPLLTGKNTASFAAQLGRDAATLYEQALSAPSGGAIQVAYAMKTWARSGNTTVTIQYKAAEAYKLSLESRKDPGSYSPGVVWREGKFDEKFREKLEQSRAARVDFQWGDQLPDKAKEQIRTWAWDMLTKLINDQLATLPRPDGEQRKLLLDGTAARAIDLSATRDINQVFTENFAFELELTPQGMLPSIGSMTNRAGVPYRWDDYARLIDLDDPFFKRVSVRTATNIDWSLAQQPITRVEVDLTYPAGPDGATRTFAFTRAALAPQPWDDAPFLVERPDGGLDRDYQYRYRIFYDGADQPFESEPMVSRRTELAVAGNTERVLAVDAKATGIEFGTADDKVREVTVLVRRIDPATGQPADGGYPLTLTAAQPTASLRKPLGPLAAPPYRYVHTAVYTFGDGRIITLEGKPRAEVELPVPGPYPDFRKVTIDPRMSEGDVATIHLVFTEPDPGDPSRSLARSTQLQLDHRNARIWTFGVFARGRGTLTWSGTLYFKDGTSEELAPRELPWSQGTITLRRGAGEAGELPIEVSPYLLDARWALDLRRVDVELVYRVDAEGVRQSSKLVFVPGRDGAPPPDQCWKVAARSGHRGFDYRITYRLAGQPPLITTRWKTCDEPPLYIPLPDEAINEATNQAINEAIDDTGDDTILDAIDDATQA